MRGVVLLLALVSAVTLAADKAVVAPQQINNHKLQASSLQMDAITIPQMLSYQGRLTDTLGVPVADTTYSAEFRLYTLPSGGSAFWNETQAVRTKGGLFSVLLGSSTPIGSIPDGGAIHLGMTVSGGAELTPRLRIASAAYSYLAERSANSDLLQGRDTTTFSRSTHNHDATYVNEGQTDAVTSGMIVNATIATVDIADTNVTMAKIARAGASTGQVVKWTGSAWAPGQDNTGGGSGVTNVYQDTGIICVPNPITSSGNVKLDLSYGDGRYVNVTGDSLTGALAVQGDLRVYGKGRIGLGNSNAGTGAFVVGQGNSAGGPYSSITGGEDNSIAGSRSHVGGGSENKADGDYAFIGGGQVNYASGGRSAIAGGSDNEAYGHHSAIGGGRANLAGDAASDTCATVGGGKANLATAMFATVGGGKNDTASGVSATVAGGEGNRASGFEAVVGGGWKNTASGQDATVGGGYSNNASGSFAFVGGGTTGTSAGTFAVIAGGSGNSAAGRGGFVGGGIGNTAGDAATDTGVVVAGGYGNQATGKYASVGGGQSDTASGDWATVGGGFSNIADTNYATVGGGSGNTASGERATVGGGGTNAAIGGYATVGGGFHNVVNGVYATAVGGEDNNANGENATVGGGYSNDANGDRATVAGGSSNAASGNLATVGGGFNNYATRERATVGGGESNSAESTYATVGGGYSNAATGYAATIPGGYQCDAAGPMSFATGTYARARGTGSFVWSDSCGAADSVRTTTSNRWVARARGGVYFYSNLGMTTGAYLAPGSNSWESACDSTTKEDFRVVDHKALLDKVAALRVRDYKMKDQNDGTRHIGPVAQDFHNAFGYGGNETSINMADADGVLLAAVQALYERDEALQMRIEQLEAELARVKKQ